MKKLFVSSLILIATSMPPVAMAQPPLPKGAAVAQTIPLFTKAVLKQELRWAIAYKKPIYAGKLMTKQEKRAFIQAMNMARTMEARQQIRELTHARLRLRAAQRGMYVIVPKTVANVARTEVKPQLRELAREPARMAVKPAPRLVSLPPPPKR